MNFSTIPTAIADLQQGKPIIVVDDEDRENEGDLVIAAEFTTAEMINFMARECRGLICITMLGERLDQLKIPMMVAQGENTSGFGSPFTVSVEASRGVTTGISAADRAHTIQVLIDPTSTPEDVASPGHMFPLRANSAGVLARQGHTEASVDLARLAGLTPAAVICEIMNVDGTMARQPQLLDFAKQHQLTIVTIEALVKYRQNLQTEHNHHTNGTTPLSTNNPLNGHDEFLSPKDQAVTSTSFNGYMNGHDSLLSMRNGINGTNGAPAHDEHLTGRPKLERVATAHLPTRHGKYCVTAYRDNAGNEHLFLSMGNINEGTPLVRLHSECMTGDVLGSVRCDCGEQLEMALQRISETGHGAVVYLRQEGRGIGLANKIRAYALQDTGLDTVEANEHLGFPADARSFDLAASILHDQGISAVRLMTNNPRKMTDLEAYGIRVVERLAHQPQAKPENISYLQTKAKKLNHQLTGV